ncbi:MAG TPA: efflux RND transporter periplasmic adaptor subunit [Balneolales bacterium]|nr:efflux RND transporter periplasmic adaptor subunit [Balneolales bacterium]
MRRVIEWIVIAAAAILIVILLINNKSKREAAIVKEGATAYPVTVEMARYAAITHNAKFIGTTEAFNDVKLLSETSGRVTEVLVSDGDRVKRNTPLVQVDDELLKANYILAEATFEKAKLDLKRYENLLKEGNLSRNDYENARIGLKNADAQYVMAKKYLRDTRITSPIDGIVVKRYVNVGSTVGPGTPVANIVDISKLKIKVNLPESDVIRVKEEMPVIVASDLYPGKSLEGIVTSISVKADDSHTYTVEIIQNNEKNLLKAGMFVNLIFHFTSDGKQLIVSRKALVGSIKDPKVYVVENNIARLRTIEVSGVTDEYMEVTRGVSEGENVVVVGQTNLIDSAAVIVNRPAVSVE